mgnify:CR=1 FL=1
MALYMFDPLDEKTSYRNDSTRLYRARIRKEFLDSVRHVFTEFPEGGETALWERYETHAGQMICMHQYLTDRHSLELSVKTADKLEELKKSLHFSRMEDQGAEIQLIKDGYVVAAVLLSRDREHIWGIRYFSRARLLRMEVYTDGVAWANTYVTAKSNDGGLYARMTRRTFYNYDGTTAYDQIFDEGKEYYLFPDGRCCTTAQFFAEFLKTMDLSEQDTVLLDHVVPENFRKPVVHIWKRARFVAVIQVGCGTGRENLSVSCFNRFYGWLKYSQAVSTMMVSTCGQKNAVTDMLQKYGCRIPEIKIMPTEGEFTCVTLKESYNGTLALSWNFLGRPDGFLIYDKAGRLIYETENARQHYFRISGYGPEGVFTVKAYVNTPEGKVVTAESSPAALKTWQYKTPRVSLIIPVYNAEDYIVRTIDTVLAQTFSGLEVILVDDGSTDHTPEILDWYAGKYHEVTVIRQANSGVPAARNTGIRHAGGQYIGFMDNDDMICPDMTERLYQSITANDCDVAVTSVYQIKDSGYEVFVQYPMKEDTAVPAEVFLADYYMKECGFGVVVWNKLYRASLVKTHLFPVMIHDDEAWTPYILSYAEKVCYLNDFSYEYDRIIRTSTLVEKWIHRSQEDRFTARKNPILFYLKNSSPEMLPLLKKLAGKQLAELERVYGYEEYKKLRMQIEENF